MATDTSNPADRVRFSNAIEGGATISFGQSVTNLSNCLIPMPGTTAGLLGLPDGATYAAGAAYVATRLAAGRAPF